VICRESGGLVVKFDLGVLDEGIVSPRREASFITRNGCVMYDTEARASGYMRPETHNKAWSWDVGDNCYYYLRLTLQGRKATHHVKVK
jgi:hypothetical protein